MCEIERERERERERASERERERERERASERARERERRKKSRWGMSSVADCTTLGHYTGASHGVITNCGITRWHYTVALHCGIA